MEKVTSGPPSFMFLEIKARLTVLVGSYYGVAEGCSLRIWCQGGWLGLDNVLDIGVRGKANCLVKVDSNGKASIAF